MDGAKRGLQGPSACGAETEGLEKPEGAGQGAGETSSVLHSTFVMACATTLSRLTGFVRTWAMAFALGNTVLASAYQVAFNVPNMLYELVAGGILTTAFLPVYLSVKSSRGDGAAWRFASNLFNIALVALGAVVILATLFAPQVIATQTFMTPGESADQAVFFFRFFAVQVLFLGLGALAGGILNAHRCYFWPNVSAAFNNLVVIVTFFGYVPLSAWDAGFARVWLAVGTTLGSVAMFACLVPSLMKVGISYTPRIDLHDPALREVARIALPVVVFTVANLVAVSFRNAFALDVAANGPSTIQYAWMWYQLPYGIVAAALSIALFTELSDFAAQGNWARFKEMLLRGVRLTVFLIVPLASALMALAYPLVSLYHAGEFTEADVALVAQVLFWWGTTLPLYAVYMYLYRVFSALKDLVTLTKVDVALRVVNIACYVVLTSGWGPFEGLGMIGIPLADTVFYVLMNAALLFMLQRRVGSVASRPLVLFVAKASVAAVAGGFAGHALLQAVFGGVSGMVPTLAAIVACGVAVVGVYGLASWALRIPEASSLAQAFRRRKGEGGEGRHGD